MQVLRDALKSLQPGQQVATVAESCSLCHDLGTIYAPTGRVIEGLNGPMEDYAVQRCPRCQPAMCPRCGDLGMVGFEVPISHPMFGKLMPCPEPGCAAVAAAQSDRRERLVQYAQLDDEYRDNTFESFMALSEHLRDGKMRAYHAALQFVQNADTGYWVNKADLAIQFGQTAPDDYRNWLVFYGEPGVGKTGMLACVVNALTAQYRPSMYARLQNWLEGVQKRYREKDDYDDEYGNDNSNQVIDRLRDAPVALVDEFDIPNLKRDSDTENKVQNVINYRYNKRLPTLITTNLDPAGIKRRWGDVIASRLRQRAHFIPMTGESLRADISAFDWE
jgi:DNA replication protein DnaC